MIVLAIPWPTRLPDGVQDVDVADTPNDKPRFIQIDIHICPTLENLECKQTLMVFLVFLLGQHISRICVLSSSTRIRCNHLLKDHVDLFHKHLKLD